MKKEEKTKKTTSKTGKTSKKPAATSLPQNIMPMGERVLEDKNIYIHQKVYTQIHKFAANKTENEHGGILVGRIVNELGKENTIIEAFIEARHDASTPTTLTFTHTTWEYFHSELEKKHKGKKIVGWIHTHPNFGIFLSENDKFIHQNFFTDTNQVAYVVDPIQNSEGFFFWIKDSLERCPGFYLFDKNGAKISPKLITANDSYDAPKTGLTSKYISAFLIIAMFFTHTFFLLKQSNDIAQLKHDIAERDEIINEMYPYFALLQQMIPIEAVDPASVPSEELPPENQEVNPPSDAETNPDAPETNAQPAE